MLLEIVYLYLSYFDIGRGLPSDNLTYPSSMSFHKNVVGGCGPESLGPGWTDSSDVSCSLSCMTRYPLTCYSFMYNYSTKLCTAGSRLSPFQSQNSASEIDLYVLDDCGAYLNFSKQVYNRTSAYVAYFPYNLTYFQAKSACQCLDSHLYVMKSSDKFAILSQLVDQGSYTWIGLDDLKDEGRYVWADDGKELDNLTLTTRFHHGQPDDHGGNQDCVFASLANGKLLLDDAFCRVKISFACEKRSNSCRN